MVDIQELGTKKSSGYYSESAKIFACHDTKYYDEIITKPQIQVREKYEHTSKYRLNHKTQEEEQEESRNQTRRKKRILLVDDEPDVCMVYQIVLEDAGFECTSYTDSVKALQEFRPAYYDLVILDIRMPKLDGFALCEKIRAVDRDVQIIFITAGEAYYENFRKQYYPEISNDININCLQKPVRNEELVQIVNTALARKQEK